MDKLVIKGGTIVDPINQSVEKKDLYVRDGLFLDLNEEMNEKECTIISADKKYILPGLIDLRCHLRQPGISFRKSIEAIGEKALSGGYTSILAMPALSAWADNPETIRYLQDSILNTNDINIYLSGCLTLSAEGSRLAPLGSLKEAGIVAVSDCPNSPQNNQIFYKAVEYASMFDLPIIELPRDYSTSPDASAHESLLSLKMGLKGSPRISEELFVQRAILVAKYSGARIHLSSVSSKGSVEMIKKAKEEKVEISCDVTSNHLFHTEEKIKTFDSLSKAYPPFREEEDRRELIRGIRQDIIDAVSTGHQPFGFHHKSREFDLAPAGTIGLENSLLQFLEIIGLGEEEALLTATKKLSENPAKILGIDHGSFRKGYSADFLIYDPKKTTIIKRSKKETGGCNLPFDEKEFKGSIEKTFVGGKCLYNN